MVYTQGWWQTAHASLRATLWMLLADLPPDLPLLLLAVADCPPEVSSRAWERASSSLRLLQPASQPSFRSQMFSVQARNGR